MTAKTPFTFEQLSGLVSTYEVGSLQRFEPFEYGNDQTNLLIQTELAHYAFRYYEKRSTEYVLFELDLLNYLKQAAYPSPHPLPNKVGRYFGIHKGKPFALFNLLDGHHDESTAHVTEVARLIAQLHTLTQGFIPHYKESRPSYDPAYCLSYALPNLETLRDRPEADSRLDWLKAQLASLPSLDALRTGVCHGDTNPSNFLYLDDRVSAVLDFDQASYTWQAYDVAHMIYWWAWPDHGDIDFGVAKSIVAAYEQERPLTAEEKSHLYHALLLVNLVSVSWFIADDASFLNDKRKVELLEAIASVEFHDLLFT